MNKQKRVTLCMVLLMFCLLPLSGCKKEQADSTPRYHGSAFDILSENCSTLERLVHLFMDHTEAFLLYDSPYSYHKDFPLWLFDNPNTDRWTCFSTSEREFIIKCKSDLFLENITLHEANTDTYSALELHFYVESNPYTIYWIDFPEDGFDKDKLEHTMEWLLRSHSDSSYIENALGINWYMLKW